MTVEIAPFTIDVQSNITTLLESYATDFQDLGGVIVKSEVDAVISGAEGEANHVITAMSKDGVPVPIEDLYLSSNEIFEYGTITYQELS